MNSSEVKKGISLITLAVVLALGVALLFVYDKLSLPTLKLKPFEYIEPQAKENVKPSVNHVTIADVEREFGCKKITIVINEQGDGSDLKLKQENIIEKVWSIKDDLSLETIIGQLALIIIKKDKQLKSFIKGDDIVDSNGNVLGRLQEVDDGCVFILVKGNIEVLNIEVEPNSTELFSSASLRTLQTKLVPKEPRTISPKSPLSENISNLNLQKSIFNGHEVEIKTWKDSDGIINYKISEEVAEKLQSKEEQKMLLSSNNYELEYLANGILVKKINHPEVQKLFNAFGVSASDIILSINGQTLGNKTEDDLVLLYQQVLASAKYVTIEILKNGVRQKFRISTEKIKNANK